MVVAGTAQARSFHPFRQGRSYDIQHGLMVYSASAQTPEPVPNEKNTTEQPRQTVYPRHRQRVSLRLGPDTSGGIGGQHIHPTDSEIVITMF